MNVKNSFMRNTEKMFGISESRNFFKEKYSGGREK